jgi:lipopolysaccharide/colanic/teichoic acid biosynthesis glycosyltransferase
MSQRDATQRAGTPQAGDHHRLSSPRLDLAPPLPVLAPASATGAMAARSPTAVSAARRRPCVGRYTPAGEWLKEASDRCLAALGLLVISPLLLMIAVAIRLDSRGPAVFRQTRLGRGGRPFTFFKFRGMYVDARARFPKLYDYRYSADQIRTLHFHSEHDPRVTRVGRFLRRTSLDELPNILNVLLGQMSLVGPRPEIPEMIPYYGEAAERVLSVKPGVTSLAKLVGRDNLDFGETLKLDLKYIRIRSLALDFSILFGTAWMVLTGRSVGF